jgi:hypothetical protein
MSAWLTVRPSAYVSVRPHGTNRLPLNGFSLNLVYDYFSRISRETFDWNLTRMTVTLHEDFCIILRLCILTVMHVLFSTLTEVFPCFFLSCKANARVYLAKDGARPALFLISELRCSMYCFVSIVLFYVLFVCKCVLLPPGVNPIAVKYIISF